MKLEQIHLKDTGSFSSLFLDYINQKPELKEFYELFPALQNFEAAIKGRSFLKDKRTILHKVLHDQYNTTSSSNRVKDNIDLLLEDNTFTITTGHQLNIFTGPLYFIYKILTVINSCELLKKKYPDNNFVPVYWMASEDHDFEEINHFHLYGKKYQWNKETKGAVGRLEPQSVLDCLEDTAFIPEKFKEAYNKQQSLCNATRQLVNDLFEEYGLVIIDPDDRQLKTIFKSTIRKELMDRASFPLVEKTTRKLEDLGYKSQITPREINLFYLENNLRERIEWTGNEFKVLNTTLSFSQRQMEQIVEESPEKFSPNVVLRPVYQEEILPNLAYIGGPAEVVYWLQLKEVFDYYKVQFPMLMPRNFAMVVNKQSFKKFSKLNIPVEKLFMEDHLLKGVYIDLNSENSYHLNGEANELEKVFEEIKEKATKIDKTLNSYVGAEFHKVKGVLETIEKKMKKAEERNQEVAISQLLGLKAKLFPEGNLQERHDNFLNFYISDEKFIDKVKALLDPFDFKFNVLLEDEES
jgi:bacillithiol synthase